MAIRKPFQLTNIDKSEQYQINKNFDYLAEKITQPDELQLLGFGTVASGFHINNLCDLEVLATFSPLGTAGSMCCVTSASGAALHFHDGTIWKKVTLT